MSDKIVCPFDPVHVIEKHKLIYHLSKCIKSYRGGHHTPVHCPLDYSHVVAASDLENHVRKCPQLALAAPLFQLDSDPNVLTGNLRMPPPPPGINDLVTGEWDNHDAVDQRGGAAAAAFSGFSDTASTVTASGYGRGRGCGSVGAAATVAGLGAAPMGIGRGRGRGCTTAPGAVGGGVGMSQGEEYHPGDIVPGGYPLKNIYYPTGFGPRGRFEQRGSV